MPVEINKELRLISISGEINTDVMSPVLQAINEIEEMDNKLDKQFDQKLKRNPIKLHINSFGGECYSCIAIVDRMLSCITPIYTYCTGFAMSAAFIIFLAGGHRYGSTHSTFMYHQILSGTVGRLKDVKESVEEMDHINDVLKQIVLDRTLIPKATLDEAYDKKKDYIIYFNEACKYNIITDEIYIDTSK